MVSTTNLLMIGIVVASAVLGAVGAAPRPNNKEWKDDQAKQKAAAGDAAANQAKMAAVDKVVTMLEDLQKQVLAEGEEEAATYNKFACFCKTNQKDKSAAIKTNKDDKTSLSADIAKFSGERGGLDKQIAGLQADIKEAEKAMSNANSKSDADLSVYKTNEADLKAAIEALQNAIKVMKSSKTPSLVQVQGISNTIKQAALMADALGLGDDSVQKVASLFLQETAPGVEMEDYKFHSSSIIETLEKLGVKFRNTKADVDADEVKRVQAHNMFTQDKTDFVKAKTHEMDQAKASRDGKIEDIGASSQELSTVSATLLDDMQYLDELNTICSQKAQTWDQRSKVRADELTALTQATGIVKTTVAEKTGSATTRLAQFGSVLHLADAVANNDAAMEAIESAAESAEDDGSALGFLQKKSIKNHKPEDGSRQLIISLLKGKGQELHSTLLASLASRIAADPFAKIKKLIQELIERLLQESANESNQKGWCDKATADATQKREYSSGKVEDLNAKMAKFEALTAKLNEELSTLNDETKELNAAVAEAEKNRNEEKTENSNTVVEANAGLEAINMAIDILDKFYKTKAKEEVKYSLSQGPLDDAPKTSFETGDAYTGAGAESGGIIGMMEVIQSDFKRTISETQNAEKLAEEQQLAFMTESAKSLAEKKVATTEKTRLRDETVTNFDSTEDNLETQTKILTTSIKELMELKSACIDTGMSYADRVAMREQEIASLKKALCILGAYAQYGPDGLADAC